MGKIMGNNKINIKKGQKTNSFKLSIIKNKKTIIVFAISFFLLMIMCGGVAWINLLHSTIDWENIIEINKNAWLINNPTMTSDDFLKLGWKILYGYTNIDNYYLMLNNTAGSLTLIVSPLIVCVITFIILIKKYCF